MNWYSLTKQSMPLPRVKNYPEKPSSGDPIDDMYFSQFEDTKNMMDSLLPEETIDPLGELDFLGAGAWGMAYTPKNDASKVVKYTSQRSEYENVKNMLSEQEERGGFSPYFAGIYSVDQVNDRIYRAVFEKVINLSRDEVLAVNHLLDYSSSMLYERTDPEKLLQTILGEEVFDYGYEEWRTPTSEEASDIKRLYPKYYKLINGLKSTGIIHDDLHGDNIGLRENGDLVVLDYGGMRDELV